MHTSGEDVSINDYLTTYIKQFKYNFHSQLTMIQSVYTECEMFEQKIQKAKESISKIQQHNFNIEVLKQKVNAKTLQRFCLRLNQYIEYRANKAKGIVQQSVFSELQAMCVALHRLFSQLTKQKPQQDGQQNLLVIFMRINQIETKYFVRVLRKMIQMVATNKIHQNAKQLLNSFVQQKLKKRFQSYTTKTQEQNNTITTDSSIKNNQRKIVFFQKISQDHFVSKLRPRKSLIERIDHSSSIYHRPSLKPSFTDLNYYSTINTSSCQLNANPEEINEFHSNYQTEESKSFVRFNQTSVNKKFLAIQDVVEINFQNLNMRLNSQSLMRQLIENNKKNSAIIDKFRRRMNRKKNKLTIFIQQCEITNTENQIKHKRSATCDQSIKKACKQVQKVLGLPQLKYRKLKI